MQKSGYSYNLRRSRKDIDVGINMVDGKLCGDVDYEDVAGKVKSITPVPGGIGAVTTSVLLKHTIRSAAAITGSSFSE